MKSWEIIADNLSKAGCSLGWVAALDGEGQTIWIVDAETSYHGKNRSPRRFHLKTRQAVLRLSEIGGRQSQFRVPGENRTDQRTQAIS